MIYNFRLPVQPLKKFEIIHPHNKFFRHLSTNSKENLFLGKVYESKKVHVGIETQHILEFLKEDKLIDMDVSDMYEHISVTI